MASEIITNSGIKIRDNLGLVAEHNGLGRITASTVNAVGIMLRGLFAAVAHNTNVLKVATAVKFLNNPNVQRCTMESKERFLRSKGLTEPEIQLALEKTAEMLDLPSMTSELLNFQARRNLLRDHVVPLLVYGGIAFGCYWFYKNCIRHLLFVEQPKKKSTSECIDELRKSLDILNANVTSLRGEMQAANQQTAARTQISELQTDIASVKGILLNRNQFPSLKTRTEPPSIPAWQMGAAGSRPAEERPRSRRSESGGSNSSEGEHATKNSDSSLEIIT